MNNQHYYDLSLQWTGNTGVGTLNLSSYLPSHTITKNLKPPIQLSTPVAFGGDPASYNPEELIMASLASCHMLIYLYLCAINDVIVTSYMDNPSLTMDVSKDGVGQIKFVNLNPKVSVKAQNMIDKANSLHQQANSMCLIANACKFTVYHNYISNLGS